MEIFWVFFKRDLGSMVNVNQISEKSKEAY